MIALALRNLLDRYVEPSRNNEFTNVCNAGGRCDRKHPRYELRGALTICGCLIPSPIDQNPCAHWRKPMDMMRQG